MTDRKIAAFPLTADKMPYPPTSSADLGADAEAAVQSAQIFMPANEDFDERRVQPGKKAGGWHKPLLLIVAALVGAAFLFAIR